MLKVMMTAAVAATIAFAVPGAAQDSPYKLGPLWNISMIDVEDGQFENYMEFLSKQWKDNQAFAKQQGWALDYHILSNEFPRDGEPDLYLITRYSDFPSTQELERRDAIMLKRMQTTAKKADAESGARVKMRRQMGAMLLRELPFK